MCREGDPLCNPTRVLQPVHNLDSLPPPPPSLSLSPTLPLYIEPGVNTTFQYSFVDCTAVVGGCTYRYYLLLRAGDMYALILDQEVEGEYITLLYMYCIHSVLPRKLYLRFLLEFINNFASSPSLPPSLSLSPPPSLPPSSRCSLCDN